MALLESVKRIARIDLSLLHNVDRQRGALLANATRFLKVRLPEEVPID